MARCGFGGKCLLWFKLKENNRGESEREATSTEREFVLAGWFYGRLWVGSCVSLRCH